MNQLSSPFWIAPMDARLPLPSSPSLMQMEWQNLLFVHWPVSVEQLRVLVPPQLTIHEYGGSAWLTLSPFSMRAVLPSFVPSFPVVSDIPAVTAFPECNLRTYVTHDGVPGVWFFSLDAASPAGVWAGRRYFHLRYFHSRINVESQGDLTCYTLKRRHGMAAGMQCAWSRGQTLPQSKPGDLAYFLTERLMLYSMDENGTLHQSRIWHKPWSLRQADLIELNQSLSCAAGIGELNDEHPVLHHADYLHVFAWPPHQAATQSVLGALA